MATTLNGANQCAGCARGLKLREGIHDDENGDAYMPCTANDLAEKPKPAYVMHQRDIDILAAHYRAEGMREAAELVAGCGKERQPSAFYESVILAAIKED